MTVALIRRWAVDGIVTEQHAHLFSGEQRSRALRGIRRLISVLRRLAAEAQTAHAGLRSHDDLGLLQRLIVPVDACQPK